MKKLLTGINYLLNAIGEPPLLNESDYSLSYEAVLANNQIEATKEEVLSEGFKFNTITQELIPNAKGYISVPPSALTLEFKDNNLTINDGLVFNRTTFTRKFDTPQEVTIIYNEDFDYIPTVLQKYIITKACLVFQRDTINDTTVAQGLEKDVQTAFMNLNKWKIKQAKANGLNSRFDRTTNPTGSF